MTYRTTVNVIDNVKHDDLTLCLPLVLINVAGQREGDKTFVREGLIVSNNERKPETPSFLRLILRIPSATSNR